MKFEPFLGSCMYYSHDFLKFVVTPTKQSINVTALKFLLDICTLLKVDHFEGFVNRNRTERFMPYT